MLSRAVEPNMIYSDRAGFLDEMNRPREVGHLSHEQRRVFDDQRDLQCEYFCFFIPNQCNVGSLIIGFSSDYSAGCYQLREKME